MSAAMGDRVGASPIHVRSEPLKIRLWLVLLLWVIRALITVLWVIVRSPVAMFTLTVAALTLLGYQGAGLGPVLAAYSGAITALVVIRWYSPATFDRWVTFMLRSRWRRFSRYRPRWTAAMDAGNLDNHRYGYQYLPALKAVSSTRTVDRVRARMLPGQTVEQWARVSDGLCQTFGAQDCRVRSVQRRPHELELWFLTRDPLTEPVQPLPPPATVNLDALPIGLCEDGTVYRLPLRGSHVLICGATGSGKGSVLWSVIDQLAPAVRRGMVQLWALDPKGGMELAFGEPLFHRFEHRGEGDFAAALEDAVEVMRRRQQDLRGRTRLHQPSPEEPLIVVLVDELAALTGYVGDRDAKRRISNALGLLLSQGRAVGVLVIAAVQDPRKETVPMRDLFPIRIALRLTEGDQVGLILGPGARDRGARCDTIPESLQGVGYVLVEGIAEPVRVRFFHVTDNHIEHLLGRDSEDAEVIDWPLIGNHQDDDQADDDARPEAA